MVSDVDESLDQLAGVSAALDAARRQVADRVQLRDAAMEASLAAGASIGEIARISGLTPARVGQILGHPFGRVGRPPVERPPAPR